MLITDLMSDPFWNQVIKSLAPLAPSLLLWLLGMVLALLRWRRHPGVSAAVLLACLLQILNLAFGVYEVYWLQQIIGGSFGNTNLQDEIERYTLITSLLSGTLSAFSWALMLLAAFGWRTHAGAAFARIDER